MTVGGMRFDRRISEDLLEALAPEGWLHPLVERRNSDPLLLDVQGRREPRGRRSWVSLYAGLSSVLDVEERGGLFRLRTHPSYRKVAPFDPAWATWQAAADLASQWTAVDSYLDAVLEDTEVLQRYLQREGKVHPLLCSGAGSGYRIIQREAVIAFPSKAARADVIDTIAGRIHGAVAATGRTDPWWPGIRDSGKLPPLGAEVDLLGVDDQGRLLVIEAKPAEELKGIAWAPAQVAVYAELFSQLLTTESEAVDHLDGMLAQRVRLGLTAPGDALSRPVRLVPVIAIGPGPLSSAALDRLKAVHEALLVVGGATTIDPFEVWMLGAHGEIEDRWLPGRDGVPAVAGVAPPAKGTFATAARAGATEWKSATAALPEAARDPAPYRGSGPPYQFCLPVPLSVHNLLPEAREIALSRFAAAGIGWHHGVAGGPSNHLLSSQVQCANCLAPFVNRPDALTALFAGVLPIEEVLPFGAETQSPHDRRDHVVFEWIGLDDHLGERGGGGGTRGANTTSADAAIRYRSTEGHVEIALIEWKYTEQYRGHELSGGRPALDVRRARYAGFWHDPASPVRTDLIPYDDLFVEPFYQLLRLQLLAWRMEQAHELGAEVVRLVYVAPSLNTELATSFNRPSHRTLGRDGSTDEVPTVWDSWAAIQRRPDRFIFMDSAALVTDESPCSNELKARYRHVGGAGVTAVQPTAAADIARLRAACDRAVVILGRVSGDGGVLRQVAGMPDEVLEGVDPVLVAEVTARLEEVAELARRVRADEISMLLP